MPSSGGITIERAAKLYALDEHYGVKISNAEAADWIKARGYETETTTADSAEPKSIADLKSRGISIVGAKKGPGSVETGEKWLDELEEIVIDYERTPHIAAEFEAIDYQVDKDGNIRNKLMDVDNHTIDATRYGCENDMGQGDGSMKIDNSIYTSFGGRREEFVMVKQGKAEGDSIGYTAGGKYSAPAITPDRAAQYMKNVHLATQVETMQVQLFPGAPDVWVEDVDEVLDEKLTDWMRAMFNRLHGDMRQCRSAGLSVLGLDALSSRQDTLETRQ